MSDITIKNIYAFLGVQKNLTDEENDILNSIFCNVDKEDEYGNDIKDGNGDGKLNNNEWSLFKKALKTNATNIYDKLTSYIQNTNENIEYDYFAKNKTIDLDMYTLDRLEKHFPDDRYNIEQTEDSIRITDKNSDRLVLYFSTWKDYCISTENEQGESMMLSYDKNHHKIISEDIQASNQRERVYYDYDLNQKTVNYDKIYDLETGDIIQEEKLGYIYQYSKDGSYSKTDTKTAERTYFDVNNNPVKTDIEPDRFALLIRNCETKEALDALLSEKLNNTNAIEILGNTRAFNLIYNKYSQYCETPEEGNNIIKNLYNAALEQAKSEGLYIEDLQNKDSINYHYNTAKLNARYNSYVGELKNEAITKDTKIEQGLTGNCWLLDKISALAQTDEGLDILNNMYVVHKGENGDIESVSVKVQGKEYTIPINEIKGSNELSSGNLYVRAIEIGVFKYLKELGAEHTFGVQDRNFLFEGMGGGNSSMGSEILIGNGIELQSEGSIKVVVDKTKSVDDDFMNELKNSSNAIIGVSTSRSGCPAYVVETGKYENVISHHAYSVIRKDDNYIYLVEPSNNKKTLRMTYKEFQDCFEVGDITPIRSNLKNNIDDIDNTAEETNIDEYTDENNNDIGKNKLVEHHVMEILYNRTDYQRMYEDVIKFREEEIERLKTEYYQKYDPSTYNVNVIFDGRFYILDVVEK
jgi:hypothetical protein